MSPSGTLIQGRVRTSFFIFMAFVFQRKTIVKAKTLESLLHVRSDNNFSQEIYTEVVNMFMAEFPEGTLRKHKQHLKGPQYPKNQKSIEKTCRCHGCYQTIVAIR